jgi:hypothetical protein
MFLKGQGSCSYCGTSYHHFGIQAIVYNCLCILIDFFRKCPPIYLFFLTGKWLGIIILGIIILRHIVASARNLAVDPPSKKAYVTLGRTWYSKIDAAKPGRVRTFAQRSTKSLLSLGTRYYDKLSYVRSLTYRILLLLVPSHATSTYLGI